MSVSRFGLVYLDFQIIIDNIFISSIQILLVIRLFRFVFFSGFGSDRIITHKYGCNQISNHGKSQTTVLGN